MASHGPRFQARGLSPVLAIVRSLALLSNGAARQFADGFRPISRAPEKHRESLGDVRRKSREEFFFVRPRSVENLFAIGREPIGAARGLRRKSNASQDLRL